MASPVAVYNLLPIPSLSASKTQSANPLFSSRKSCSLPFIHFHGPLRSRIHRYPLPVVAAQSNFLKVLQSAYRVGKDGIEAGTNLVPDSVPRPVARISVTVVAVTVGLFVLKSFLSTAFFVLGTMGLVYFIFIALNKDEGPRGGGGGGDPTSTEDSLEDARRIMEKYK